MSKKKKMFEVEEVDSSIEELILTGLISDKAFASLIHHVVKKEYFNGQLTGMLSLWCVDYFKRHKDVPQRAILNVIKMQSKRLDSEDQELIPNIKDLARECFKRYKVESFNTEYIAAKSLEYLETNFLVHKTKKITRALEKDNSREAIRVYREGAKELFQEFKKLDTFPNADALREMMNPDKRKSVMSFPGYMGYYMKPLKRAKFIAMFGPTKRGKSHWLVEWVLQGALSGLNVAYFPLEMTKEESEELIVSRWLNQEFVEEEDVTHKMYDIPIFDCIHNQRGDCEKKFCKGTNENIFDDDTGCLSDYESSPDHKACDVCREKGKKHKKDYELSSWFTTIKRPVINRRYLREFKDQFDLHCKGTIKIKNYLLGRGTLADIDNDLDNEETFNNWIPDLIVIDSLDNFKKNTSIKDGRGQISDIWNDSATMAKGRNALLVSATQGNRGSFQKDRLEAEDVAEDWNKALVVDGLFAINERGSSSKNKTQKDKYWGRQQIELLLSRYKKFIPMHQCMVLNNFSLGQTLLDSENCWFQPL